MGERRGAKGLELWCRRMTEGYAGVEVNNMTTSWRDGLAFCAIIHHFRPDLIDFSKLNKEDVYENNMMAFQIAEEYLGIPALLEPADMVKFLVPDRLSILTYLSQFYNTLSHEQGSASRTVPKRISNAADRPSISPPSTSPTSKMPKPLIGTPRREPCAKCGLPVVIAERLHIHNQLYHRTCFTCFRCHSQLNPADFAEADNRFCCSTCPDDQESNKLSRSLSDEEKSKKLDDYYSDLFETALENEDDDVLNKRYTIDQEKSKGFVEARTRLLASQLGSNETSDLAESVEVKNEPPDLLKFVRKSLDLVDHIKDNISSVNDSESLDCSTVNSDSDRNQPKTANKLLDDDSTKESVAKIDTINYRDNEHEQENHDVSVITVSDELVITISSDSGNQQDTSNNQESLDNSKEKYPGDLNPFGDESDSSPEVSLNPFDEDDEIEDTVPMPNSRKKISVRGCSDVKPLLYAERYSYNPFEDSDEAPIAPTRKFLKAPKLSLDYVNENEKSDSEVEKQPVPLPRKERTSHVAPASKQSGLESSSIFGSNTSLSSTETGNRKKKVAPKPPTVNLSAQGSAQSSVASTPCTSTQHSPKLPRSRKAKRAPLPPTSTPMIAKNENVEVAISPIVFDRLKIKAEMDGSEVEQEKVLKDELNRNRQSSIMPDHNRLSIQTYIKRQSKGRAPSLPVAEKRSVKPFPLQEIKQELDVIEIQMQGLEKQGARLEELIREKCEGPDADTDAPIIPEVDNLIIELFELVNEKNGLFRRQAELMYLRRQQRLEEEHADLEYQIRCLLLIPERNKTDSDKMHEEDLIKRLYQVVEERNEIIECLEMDRVREIEEDDSINSELTAYSSKSATVFKITPSKKKLKRFKLKKKVDADKDIDESETSIKKEKKKKKKFSIF